MSEEKIHKASWNFHLSSVVPFLFIIPLLLSLLGKVFGWTEVEKISGYMAAGVLGIFVVAFLVNLIWWRKSVGSAEAKTKRAEAVIEQIISDNSLELEFKTKNRSLLRVRSSNNNLINIDTGAIIDPKDLALSLIESKDFPRISKTQ